MKIRQAHPGDEADVAALYVRTRSLAYASFFPAAALAAMSVAGETGKWQVRIDAEDSVTFVAEDFGPALGGFVHIVWHEAAEAEIGFMYVATEYQGGGLGRKLMAHAEAVMSAAGATTAHLWVYEANHPARRFYERCGWQHDGGERASTEVTGPGLLRYRKPLPGPAGGQ